jgi:hypothetical protein
MDKQSRQPTAQDLERDHPRWQVWQAEESGEWWASVRRNLTPTQERAGCVPHLAAESAAELEQLLTQDDARTAPALPVRVVAWGRTRREVEFALTCAGGRPGRAAWQFVSIERSTAQQCPISPGDPSAIAADHGEFWAYAVYRVRSAS